MKWRNPKIELPEDNEIVWVMLKPHKGRDTLLESAPSIQINCGWVSRPKKNGFCRVEMGSTGWSFDREDARYEDLILAWLPVNEMPLPEEMWNI